MKKTKLSYKSHSEWITALGWSLVCKQPHAKFLFAKKLISEQIPNSSAQQIVHKRQSLIINSKMVKIIQKSR